MSVVADTVSNMTRNPAASPSITLDSSQRAVLEAVRAGRSLAVIGAPGTGKSTALIESVTALINDGVHPDEVLVLGSDRRASARLRDALAQRLRMTGTGTLGRSVLSVAFELVRHDRAARGLDEPRLITGADEDSALAEVLEEEAAAGAVGWPDPIGPDVLRLRGFRAEARDMLALLAEHDLEPGDLALLERHEPLWGSVAQLAEAYREAQSWRSESAFSAPELANEAVSVLAERIGAPNPNAVFGRVRFVLADDAQELPESSRRLIEAFETVGANVVTFGDPDVATGGFHGARAEHATSWRQPGLARPDRIVLETVHRHGSEIRDAIGAVVERIGVSSGVAGHRTARPVVSEPLQREEVSPVGLAWEPPEPVTATIAEHAVGESERIAAYLRELHLGAGIAYAEMAVVARSAAALAPLARLLARHDIPTTRTLAPDAIDEPAVVALVDLTEIASGVRALTPEAIFSLATSPLGGATESEMRAVRRALRLAERQTGSVRPTSELLLEAINARAALIDLDASEREPVGRPDPLWSLERAAAPAVRSGVAALARIARAMRAANESAAQSGAADEVLFAAWDALGIAEPWRREALGHGAVADRANDRLDAIVALFDSAKRFVERTPDAPVGVFLTEWSSRRVMADSLAKRIDEAGVVLTTPAGLIGREFEAVVVSGLNEGAWPNLRLRDPLLRAGRLSDALRANGEPVARSVADRRTEVLHDELRLLAKTLGAAKRYVLLAAVRSEESEPSPVIDWPCPPDWRGSVLDGASDLRSLTAMLRRDAQAGTGSGREHEQRRAAARSALGQLASANVPGASPESWLSLTERTTEAPITAGPDSVETTVIRLSPSGVDAFETCPVDWFVSRHGGSPLTSNMGLGVLVHAAGERDFASLDERFEFVRSQLWQISPASAFERDALTRKARHLVENLSEYLHRQAIADVTVLGVERPFLLEIDGASYLSLPVTVRVSGTIDRIEQLAGSGAIRIVDFKTGKNKQSAADVAINPQLGTYRLAIAEGVVGEARGAESVDSGDDGTSQPGLPPSIDPGGPIPADPPVDAAVLVYLGTPEPAEVQQTVPANPANRDALDELNEDGAWMRGVRERLVRVAHGMAGIDIESLDAKIGQARDPFVPPNAAVDGALQRRVFRFHPEQHCDAFGAADKLCAIHRIPEVTE